MARTTLGKWTERWALVAACVPLALLTGCPQNQSGAPGKISPQATAPAVAPATTQPAVSTAQSIESAANAYKAQQLINDAEKAYRSGVDNYRAGHLDAARIDFDFAVDVMLTSGMDLKSDPAAIG